MLIHQNWNVWCCLKSWSKYIHFDQNTPLILSPNRFRNNQQTVQRPNTAENLLFEHKIQRNFKYKRKIIFFNSYWTFLSKEVLPSRSWKTYSNLWLKPKNFRLIQQQQKILIGHLMLSRHASRVREACPRKCGWLLHFIASLIPTEDEAQEGLEQWWTWNCFSIRI